MFDSRTNRTIGRLCGGAILGAVIILPLAKSGALEAIATWRPEEIASTILAGLLLMIALITGGFSTSRKGYRALTDEGMGEPIEDATLSTLRRQALVTGLAALLLLIPPIGAHLGLAGPAAIGALAAMGVLLALEYWLNRSLTRSGDELSRAVSAESSVATLAIATPLLFGWAALEKLSLVPAIDSWTILTMAIALSLVVGMWVSVRRGLVAR
jgi:hypothetical protein